MASPMPQGQMNSWNQNQGVPPPPSEPEEYSVQTRVMGLKVHYTFDKESKVNCLARSPQTLNLQTIPLDEKTTIGVVDLRACIHTITLCSPEIVHQECDYTIYATDYTEPDTPLVGQGLLSWALDSMRGGGGNQEPRMVTGRVTKNLMGVFGGGNRETLEVRLKFSEINKVQRAVEPAPVEVQQPVPLQPPPASQPGRPMDGTLTPNAAAEWGSFMQSNHQMNQSHGLANNSSRISSPIPPQGPPPPHPAPPGVYRNDSFEPSYTQNAPPQEAQRVAPIPIELQETPNIPASSSRPSSRASNRSSRRKPPTGRPRGRPRKKPAEGNTSGYEDGTEGEDGPAKKRAKTIKVDRNDANPFSGEHESLRVAASTSGSIRNFRPVGMNLESAKGNPLQEVPRAPTPVPDGLGSLPGPKSAQFKPRRESALSQPPTTNYSTSFSDLRTSMSPGRDDRSPESIAPTPHSEDSPPDIGSSPPVQRATPFRSSPPPSSPVLPPMPVASIKKDATFGSSRMQVLYGGESNQVTIEEELPPRPPVRWESNKGGVPMQVFQIQGPAGHDLVHIMNYNTPLPSSCGAAPPEGQSLPRLKQDSNKLQSAATGNKKKRVRASSPPAPRVMTPPPTTDSIEKPVSPATAAIPTYAQNPPICPPVSTRTVAIAPTPIVPPPGVATAAAAPSPIPLTDTPAMVTTPLSIPTTISKSPSSVTPEPVGPNSPVKPAPGLPQEAEVGLPMELDIANVDERDEEDPVFQLAHISSLTGEGQGQGQASAQSTSLPQLPKSNDSKPKYHRQLNRSQSTGPLMLPCVPASDPIGPSTLSQSSVNEQPNNSKAAPPLRRATSTGPSQLTLPIPGPVDEEHSPPVDAGTPEDSITHAQGVSLLAPPSSPPAVKSNKNIVKKHAIKQRLMEAINNGEMPPFCSNCGAIETPTWRKTWVQDFDGVPEQIEYSEKPGKVTALEILERDEENKPTKYRLLKKSLAPSDDRAVWQEKILCNPCGIWLAKCKCHRPADRWDKDLSRLGQERRKRGSGRSNSRNKKGRSKDDALVHPTSEAYVLTDPVEALETGSPKLSGVQAQQVDLTAEEVEQVFESLAPKTLNEDIETQSNAGSTHSRGTGTAQSPIDVEFDDAVGNTKRLLFPSPRKNGVPKVLGDVDVNLVHSVGLLQNAKEVATEKENAASALNNVDDELEALFGSPVSKERPSTPPSNAKCANGGPFKTPTRPTPSHRPITRSVSRSLRSIRSILSPNQQRGDRTPTQTPKSATRRRTPRNHENHDTFNTATSSRDLTQLLSNHVNFDLGDQDLDLNNLPALDAQTLALLDFGNLLGTDPAMTSSPPNGDGIEFDYTGAANAWTNWILENGEP